MIEPLNNHYSFTNPASVYDEEALTALELAGRTTAKVNEVVKDQNALRTHTENQLNKQDADITAIRTVTVPADVSKEMQKQIDNGTFDKKIDESLGNLEQRMDNLLSSVPSGGTSMDAELVDIRVRLNGANTDNAGNTVRHIESEMLTLRQEMLNVKSVKYLVVGGGKIHTNGKYVVEGAMGTTGLIDCRNIKEIEYKTNHSNNVGGVLFFNENMEVMTDDCPSSFTNTPTRMTVPDGAFYVALNNYYNTQKEESSHDKQYILMIGVDNSMSDVVTDLKAQNEMMFTTLFNNVTDYRKTLEWGACVEPSGNVVYDEPLADGSGGCWSGFVPIAGFDYLEWCVNYGDGSPCVAFYTKEKVFIPELSITENPRRIVKTLDLSSVDAYYVVVSGWINASQNDRLTDFYMKLGKKKDNHNKRMILFGDSITQTADMNEDGTDYVENAHSNWVKHIPSLLDNVVYKNYAYSGAHWADFNSSHYFQHMTRQVTCAINDGENQNGVDVIVIACGTNDLKQTERDTYEEAITKDVSQLDVSKLNQSIRWCLYTLTEKFPTAKCFLVTPLQRSDVEVDAEFLGMLKQMANRYGFTVLDAHGESGIIRDFETNSQNGRYLSDGLHTNTDGQRKQAEYICNRLKLYL